MGFLIDRWRQIGTRLYLALGFAVFLTLVSSAVGVYYFEQSGDLNFRIRSESAPVLDAAWSAEREAAQLQAIGLRLLSDPVSDIADARSDTVAAILNRIEASLQVANGDPELATESEAVYNASFELAGAIDEIAVNRDALIVANDAAAKIQSKLANIAVDDPVDYSALNLLQRALVAPDDASLSNLWNDFVAVASSGIDQSIVDLAGGDSGVFAVRGTQLVLETRIAELSASFEASGSRLNAAVASLVVAADVASMADLESAGETFDQGRVLLAVISVASVLAATLASWLWVGNGLLRRLTRLSERMQLMARGDLETPMPEVGADEIGELAGALEVFRRQALEVQRLNLVEQLYGELQQANEELTRMQARLVANEKLAALGDLVSGVAHEISNPMNFVKNFSEGSLELFEELTEIIDNYRDALSEEDVDALEDVKDELATSLNRVQENGGRVLTIVDRMRGLGVVGGTPEPTDLNTELDMAARAACISFENDNGFKVVPRFALDRNIGEIPLAANDFGEAVRNLVSNACYAMRNKSEALGDGYQPDLLVSTRLAGDEVEVRFKDNGPGISEDMIERVFDLFFSTREGALGAGLGLPLVSDVARRAGGDLTVDTVYGEYAEFKMTFPVERASIDE